MAKGGGRTTDGRPRSIADPARPASAGCSALAVLMRDGLGVGRDAAGAAALDARADLLEQRRKKGAQACISAGPDGGLENEALRDSGK
jgi:hypothetical protein